MEIVKEKTIAFTGNRTLISRSFINRFNLKSIIAKELYTRLEREYLDNGITNFMSGFAIGFDLLAAMVVVELKKQYDDIKLIAVIPFLGQEEKYSPKDKFLYNQMLAQADEDLVLAESYTSNALYHKRNDFLIDNATKIYAYYNGAPRSGTGSTMRKATTKGIETVNLYEMI